MDKQIKDNSFCTRLAIIVLFKSSQLWRDHLEVNFGLILSGLKINAYIRP